MKVIRSGFRGNVHDSTPGAAIFGSEAACHDTELLNRIQRDFNSDVTRKFVVVGNTVEHDVCGSCPQAVNGDTCTATAGIRIGNIADRLNEVVWISRQAWQLENFLSCDSLADRLI